MDLEVLTSAASQIAEESNIPHEQVVKIVEDSLAAAYKKDYGQSGEEIKASLDLETGAVQFWQIKQVITLAEKEDEKIHFNPLRSILLKKAKKSNPKIKVGDDLHIPLETKTTFGRIAAQTAKQILLQKVKEAHRESVYQEYKEKEGEVITGLVQRIESAAVYFDLGDAIGILPEEEQCKNERYRLGQRIKLYLLSIDNTSKGPVIFLSRAYPKLISKLFELEVPEIGEGQIVIKSIAREAGSHCKVAVSATDENTDPIGAMVGQKGTRILTITNELNGEKIDVIRWAEDSSKYVGFALAPAKVRRVEIEEPDRAKVFVDADQLSLTIGKNGQNVRLAAKLTGWKIDVQEYKADIKEDEEKEEKADIKEDKKKKEKVDAKDTKESKKKEEKVKPDKEKAPKKATRTKKSKPDKK